eukprot:scaffold18516_cov91-Skeletonema_dohrnii-CCMP3373.AAC.3
MTSPPRTRSKGGLDGKNEDGEDGVDDSINAYFSHFEGDSNNDERKPSANTDNTPVTKANADIADFFTNSLVFTSAGTNKDPPTKQPTPDEIKQAEFPTGTTVDQAIASAEIERPDLYRRLSNVFWLPSQPVAVLEHETKKLLRVFPTIVGVRKKKDDKPCKESLAHAFGGRGSLTSYYKGSNGELVNHFFELVFIERHSEYLEKLKKVTDESKARFDYLAEKAKKMREFTQHSKFSVKTSKSQRSTNQIIEVYEWREDEKRISEKPLHKFSGTSACSHSFPIGNNWKRAGYAHLPSDKFHEGVIWKKLFFIKFKTIEVDEIYDVEEAFNAIEVDNARYEELKKRFHFGKCRKGCDCVMSSAIPDYMLSSNYESFKNLYLGDGNE